MMQVFRPAFLVCLCIALAACQATAPKKDDADSEKNPRDQAVIGSAIGAAIGAAIGGSRGNGAAIGTVVGQSITDHKWMPVSTPPGRKWTGPRPTYVTYVLAGEIGGANYDGSNEKIAEARRNLAALVSEVKSLDPLTPEASRKQRTAPGHQGVNLYLIPEASTGSGAERRSVYDYYLSRAYRNRMVRELPVRNDVRTAFRGYGPFLIALKNPINDLDNNPAGSATDLSVELFMMDLSGAAEKSIPVYLSAFKDAIEKNGVKGVENYESWRADAVSFLLNLNQHVPLLATATMSIPAAAKGLSPR